MVSIYLGCYCIFYMLVNTGDSTGSPLLTKASLAVEATDGKGRNLTSHHNSVEADAVDSLSSLQKEPADLRPLGSKIFITVWWSQQSIHD
jgi:hypothetical protein